MAYNVEPVIDLPYQYYSAIGEFLFQFAQLEYRLHEIIWAAFDIGLKEGRIMTIGTASTALQAMALTLTGTARWAKTPQHKQEINMVAHKLREYAPKRNAIAHGAWGSRTGLPTDASLYFMKEAHERVLPKKADWDDRQIKKWADDLRSANERAKKLLVMLNDARQSLQKKSSAPILGHQTNRVGSPKARQSRLRP